MTSSAPPPSPRPGGLRPIRAVLWVIFAALMVASGDLVLRACGTFPALGFSRNYCPAPPDRSFAREIVEGRRLRREIHVVEMALVDQQPCPAGVRPPAPIVTLPAPVDAPAPPPSVLPPVTALQPEPAPPDTREMDRRVDRDSGGTGELQITLAWDTLDDLDLNVTCPGGHISSRDGEHGPGVCGDGVKDIDANRNLTENVSSTPVENIVWSGNVPDGEYVIEIIEYRANVKNGEGNTVPFTLRMRLANEERTCHSQVVQHPASEMEAVNGQIRTGFEQVLKWHTGQPLPDCDFTEMATIRATGSK